MVEDRVIERRLATFVDARTWERAVDEREGRGDLTKFLKNCCCEVRAVGTKDSLRRFFFGFFPSFFMVLNMCR